jgi:hypothetical protein
MSGSADATRLALQAITAARADGVTCRLKDGRLHAYDSKDKLDGHRLALKEHTPLSSRCSRKTPNSARRRARSAT